MRNIMYGVLFIFIPLVLGVKIRYNGEEDAILAPLPRGALPKRYNQE